MFDKTGVTDAIADAVHKILRQGPGLPTKEDLETNLKAALNIAFSKMQLLTQDEFAAQTAVLQKTRAMVESLEKRLSELEKRLDAKKTGNAPRTETQ
ncbi:MAG: accessory factor UbiK family protein [Kistimonas sp.]|nr:accessory factor UbiK family protein [Kistimonas sp.]